MNLAITFWTAFRGATLWPRYHVSGDWWPKFEETNYVWNIVTTFAFRSSHGKGGLLIFPFNHHYQVHGMSTLKDSGLWQSWHMLVGHSKGKMEALTLALFNLLEWGLFHEPRLWVTIFHKADSTKIWIGNSGNSWVSHQAEKLDHWKYQLFNMNRLTGMESTRILRDPPKEGNVISNRYLL